MSSESQSPSHGTCQSSQGDPNSSQIQEGSQDTVAAPPAHETMVSHSNSAREAQQDTAAEGGDDEADESEMSPDEILQRIVKETPEATRSWHKELLFGLFLDSDDAELCSIAEKAGAPRLTNLVKNQNQSDCGDMKESAKVPASDSGDNERNVAAMGKKRARPSSADSQRGVEPSVLSLVPHVLFNCLGKDKSAKQAPSSGTGAVAGSVSSPREAATRVGSQDGPAAASAAPVPLERRNVPGCSSLDSIEHVEQAVAKKFHESDHVKKALQSFARKSKKTAAGAKTGREPKQVSKTPAMSVPTTVASRKGTQERGEKSSRKEVDDAAATFVPFSLTYNECSMSAIAAWACRKSDAKESKEGNTTLETFVADASNINGPAPAAMFRRCLKCNKWGHYEIQCEHLESSDAVELFNDLNVQTMKQSMVKDEENKKQQSASRMPSLPVRRQPPRGTRKQNADVARPIPDSSAVCNVCKFGCQNEVPLLICARCSRSCHAQCVGRNANDITRDEQWYCERCQDSLSDTSSVVDIEGCDGFIIEQRKPKRTGNTGGSGFHTSDVGLGFPHDGWSAAVGVGHVRWNDGLEVVEEPLSSGYNNAQSHEFVQGELCWARRNELNMDSPGEQADWWPSVIVSVGANSHRTSRYLVKKFALVSGRSRVSTVLPFLKHFERLGYDRVHAGSESNAIESEDEARFRKALNMAIAEIGCNSFSQVLSMAREDCCRTGPTSQKSCIQYSEFQADDSWSDAEATELDGVLIRARRDPSIDPEERSVKATALLAGSLVAWFPETMEAAPNDDITGSDAMRVGVVQAAKLGQETALIRPIRNWQEALSQPVQRDWFSVQSCSVGASTWIETTRLHVLWSGAPERLNAKFSTEALPKRLREEREHLKMQYRETGTMSPRRSSSFVACVSRPGTSNAAQRLRSRVSKISGTSASVASFPSSYDESAVSVEASTELAPKPKNVDGKLAPDPRKTRPRESTSRNESQSMADESRSDNSMSPIADNALSPASNNIASKSKAESSSGQTPSSSKATDGFTATTGDRASSVAGVPAQEQEPPSRSAAKKQGRDEKKTIQTSVTTSTSGYAKRDPVEAAEAARDLRLAPSADSAMSLDCGTNSPSDCTSNYTESDVDAGESSPERVQIGNGRRRVSRKRRSEANLEEQAVDSSQTFTFISPSEAAKMRKRRKSLSNEDTALSDDKDSTMSTASSSGKKESSGNATKDCSVNVQSELSIHLHGEMEGVYEVEKILDDRVMTNGSRPSIEYYIKWKGYPMDQCTWEPRKNIMNASLIDSYYVEKMYKVFATKPEAKKPGTASYRIFQALTVGRSKLEQVVSLPESPPRQGGTKKRTCPFCMSRFTTLPSHMKFHGSEPNYKIIKEAAMLVEEEWYADKTV